MVHAYALTALLGAVVLLALFLPRLLLGKRSGRGWSVLIVGPSGGGKTTLLMRLEGRQLRGTATSMAPNRGTVHGVQLVDVPGHPRLADSYFQAHVANCKGVVAVVDALNYNATKEEFARHVYRLLTSPVIRGRGIPILVACNKADCGAKAHSTEFIRKRTEKLIQQLYEADVGDSMREGAGALEHNILSPDGGAFSFDQLREKRRFHRPIEVSFHSVSAKGGDLEPVRDFIVSFS